MENASKALIMAGAILIALIIVSLGVIVFRNMAGSVERNSSLTQEQMSAFNNKITPYIGENVSGSQVNALIQFARAVDQDAVNKGDTMKIITITSTNLDGAGVSVSGTTVQYKNVQTGQYYKVTRNL